MCSLYYSNKLVWKGVREPQTRLWVLPLQYCNATSPKIDTRNTRHMACNSFSMTSKAAIIKYLHQAAFSLPKQTLLKAINNKQFSTCPGFTARAVQKYLPDSALATDKVHMKIQKQVIWSTKEKIKTVLEILKTKRDLYLPITTDKDNHPFAYHATINPKDGTIYVDFTVKFLSRSIELNTAIFVL